VLLSRHRPALPLLLFAILAGCAEAPRDHAASDTASQTVAETVGKPNAPASPTNPFAPLWDSAFGNLVGYNAGDSSIVVLLASFAANVGADTTLDASPANGTNVDLFGRTGIVGSATLAGLGKASDEEGCFEYSRGRLQGRIPLRWDVALPVGTARGLALEDLSQLRGADSAALVTQILSLGAMVRHREDSLWTDAKFVIEQATRLKLSDATVITGSLTWLRPNPEHWARDYFVLGEASAAGQDSGSVRLAYVHPNLGVPGDSTASGLDSEDEIGVSTAVETKADSRPVLFLETRGNEANGYAALGRIAPGRWRLVWNGPHEGGC